MVKINPFACKPATSTKRVRSNVGADPDKFWKKLSKINNNEKNFEL